MSIANLFIPNNSVLYDFQLKSQIQNSNILSSVIVSSPITAANIQAGLLANNAGSPTNLQMPTAAQIVAQFPTMKVNDALSFCLTSVGAGTLTLTTNTGITVQDAGNLCPAHGSRIYYLIFTSITSGSEGIILI